MTFKSIFLSFAILFFSTTLLAITFENSSSIVELTDREQQARPEYLSHIVSSGETVYSISKSYGTTVDMIYQLNPNAKEGINVGQELVLPEQKKEASNSHTHTILLQETLYGVSAKYSVSMSQLVEVNPGLNEQNFTVGKTINIPTSKVTTSNIVQAQKTEDEKNETKFTPYIVGKQETLYSLSKKWDVTISELESVNPSLKTEVLKEGALIYIPSYAGSTTRSSEIHSGQMFGANDIKLGIFLPFEYGSKDVPKEKIVEYYEGMLLAIRDLKQKGLNATVYTFDIGSYANSDRLKAILETSEAKSLNMIIGGISSDQIRIISDFSKANGMRYVVPFGSAANNEIDNNPFLYQAMNMHSNLYHDIAEYFKIAFPIDASNVIFLSNPGENNRDDFVSVLKKSLLALGMHFNEVTLTSSANDSDYLEPLLSTTKNNIIIPSSSTEASLKRVLNTLVFSDNKSITLFGYPEWQLYITLANSLHKYNTYMYGIFEFDNGKSSMLNFNSEYRKWYGKNLINSYPKYGCLGYDTALYFLTAMKDYGSSFEHSLNRMNVPTIQSAMHFGKKNETGGYINDGIYFIHYKTNGTKEIIDCSKQW